MTAAALLAAKPQATDHELREGLNGLKCRGGTQLSLVRAINRAALKASSSRTP